MLRVPAHRSRDFRSRKETFTPKRRARSNKYNRCGDTMLRVPAKRSRDFRSRKETITEEQS